MLLKYRPTRFFEEGRRLAKKFGLDPDNLPWRWGGVGRTVLLNRENGKVLARRLPRN